MSFITKLIYPIQHCEDAAAHLLSALNIKYTTYYLQRELLKHPDYPSLMAIADVIGASYNIACTPLKIQKERISSEPEIKPPFIAHIKTQKGGLVFAIVTEFTAEQIVLYNPGSKQFEKLSSDDFDAVYMGTLLVIENDESRDNKELNYQKNRKTERKTDLLLNSLVFSLPVLTIVSCLAIVIGKNLFAMIAPIAFTILTLCGCIISAILLWHEIDEYNPALKNICQASRRMNCSAVLHSKASKIFGVSWSSIGFCYFMGMLMTLLVTGIADNFSLELLSWINITALPYVAFSIFYQSKVVKQWCLLCLLSQAVLIGQCLIATIGKFHTRFSLEQIPAPAYFSIITCFVFVFIVILLIVPSLKKGREGRRKEIELQQLKQNPQIFESLLARQKSIEEPGKDLGITIGNPDGLYKLIKVCNPYCGPCARSHSIIEELIENNEEICLQIIFTTSEDDADIRKATSVHLLAIDSKNDKALTQKALSDWYTSPVKDYTRLAAQYPLNGELQQQDAKIKAMRDWCITTEIKATPTFFLCTDMTNVPATFYQLPRNYTIDSLKYFLMV